MEDKGMSDKETIADLCKPLSAKVMPRRSLFGSDHAPTTQEHALAMQRSSLSNSIGAKSQAAMRRLERTKA